ncbi:UNVERIFIED_CONTAM: hypothetical protein K2H54_062648 [Gekko kuhli]
MLKFLNKNQVECIQGYATTAQEAKQKAELSTDQAEAANNELEAAKEQLSKATEAARYLAEQNRTEREVTNHGACRQEIDTLKKPPGRNAKSLFYVEHQGPGEDSETYMAQNMLLAELAEIVAIDEDGADFNDDDFKEAPVEGLNGQTKLTIAGIDPLDATWDVLEAHLQLAL